MSKSLEDQISRLRAMIDGYNGSISAKEREAISLAVQVLSVIQWADKHGHPIETYDMDRRRGGKPYMLAVGSTAKTTRESYGNSLLECFSEAGRAL